MGMEPSVEEEEEEAAPLAAAAAFECICGKGVSSALKCRMLWHLRLPSKYPPLNTKCAFVAMAVTHVCTEEPEARSSDGDEEVGGGELRPECERL